VSTSSDDLQLIAVAADRAGMMSGIWLLVVGLCVNVVNQDTASRFMFNRPT